MFVTLNNGTYGALRGFAAERADSLRKLHDAFTPALAADGPTLIEVPISTISPF